MLYNKFMSDEKIIEEIKTFLKKDSIKINDNLRDLGIDSLDLLDFILEAEEKFNIKIEDDELLNLNTISDVVALIKTKF